MMIVCENCKTSFELDDSAIQDKVFRVRCSECNHVFTAYKSPPSGEVTYLLKKNAATEQHKTPPVSTRKIIAISNQKGGVGKTSTCLNLGTALSLLNKRVLLVDFDLQASMTILFGHKGKQSLYDLLDASTEEMLAAIQNPYRNLWLLPSNNKMMLLQNYNNKKFEWTLKDKLNPIIKHFDYILIDTPPSVEFFTLNALMAADSIIIPTQCEFLSLNGVSCMDDILQSIKQKKGAELQYRILATMYDEQNIASKAIYNKLKSIYKEKLFEVVIEVDKKIQESQIFKKPVIYYDKNSKSASQYLALAKAIMS
jgi:chromosome partitioning protein